MRHIQDYSYWVSEAHGFWDSLRCVWISWFGLVSCGVCVRDEAALYITQCLINAWASNCYFPLCHNHCVQRLPWFVPWQPDSSNSFSNFLKYKNFAFYWSLSFLISCSCRHLVLSLLYCTIYKFWTTSEIRNHQWHVILCMWIFEINHRERLYFISSLLLMFQFSLFIWSQQCNKVIFNFVQNWEN